MNKRLFNIGLLVGGLGLAGLAAAQGSAYPNAPITVVVPFAAGSGTDAVARVVMQKLSEEVGQPVLVDNRPGASAQIAAQFVVKAKPDGYTLFMTTNTSHSANPSLFKALKYDPIKDFTPIARTGELPFVLAVNNDLPVHNVQELIDYAKAHPGKLSYATPNSTSQVASETIKRIAGIDVLGIPYKSSPQSMTDLIGGQVQMYVVDLGSGMGMIKTGKVRPIGVTTAQPLKDFPGVAPIAGTVKGFDLTSWNGVFGPAGLPPEIVKRINDGLQIALADPEVQARLDQLGFQVWPSRSPQEFADYVAQQLAHWTALIKAAGIEPQ
ncbi:tripartite tricarboxylate transporter substrate binding protein [Comamonas faecalis]|uniref:Tripartite tricarboxylate transporter substrate binding protein n=1 Tax=Comamonas faecalis TaxID=1387849 RepID=A0ABP7RZQ0_9BURK